jgi:hypothetical protein
VRAAAICSSAAAAAALLLLLLLCGTPRVRAMHLRTHILTSGITSALVVLLLVVCGPLLLACAAPADVAKWPWPHRGDVRAVITVTPAELSAAAGGPLAAVVQWRRRDAHPEQKAVIVTDSRGQVLGNVTTPVVEQDRGVVVFTPTPGQSTYYVYYMPYTQSGIGQAHLKWDASGAVGGNWAPAANFSSVQKGSAARQVFALPKPVKAQKFRWTCTQTWGSNPSWQGFLRELEFRTKDGWLPNHATSVHQAPVDAASSWQPNNGNPPSGHAWQAMDGDPKTIWDPRATPAWLVLDFGKELTVDAVGIMTEGDTTHDIKAFELDAAPTKPAPPHPVWQELPQVPASGIRLEPRDEFYNIMPMGLPANSSEVSAMLAAHPSASPVLIFPESRDNKVMMEDRVPFRWTVTGPSTAFVADVRRGEWYYWQLGMYTTKDLSSITLSPLTLRGGQVSLRAQCLNTEGSTSLGEDVSPTQRPNRPGFESFLVSAAAGTVKALWIGVELPVSRPLRPLWRPF